jgi:hypothetical protein
MHKIENKKWINLKVKLDKSRAIKIDKWSK